MQPRPLDRTHGPMTSSVACYNWHSIIQMVERCLSWNPVIALVQHTQMNNVGHGVRSSPLDSKKGRITSGVACHHRSWTAHTVGRRWALYAIIILWLHTQTDDIMRGMPSKTFDNKKRWTASEMEWHHNPWISHTIGWVRVWKGIIALGQTHNRKTLDVAWHHSP